MSRLARSDDSTNEKQASKDNDDERHNSKVGDGACADERQPASNSARLADKNGLLFLDKRAENATNAATAVEGLEDEKGKEKIRIEGSFWKSLRS